jgi:putative ABC transport system permease protein
MFNVFGGDAHLVIRTTGAPPLALAESVRRVILEADPAQPVANIRSFEDVLGASVAQRRFIMMLLGVFAGASLLLAAIGLYGFIAYGVSRRAHEIGVRRALGAQRGDVLRLIVLQGVKLIVVGTVIGLAGALALTRLIESLLFEVKTTDPMTFGLVVALLGIIALFACYIPALRVTKVDPLVALKSE